MSILVPSTTTVGDLVAFAAKLSGKLAMGQSLPADDATDGWAMLQMMLQQWQRKRWHVYRIISLSLPCTGAQYYTIGPGGQFDTGTGTSRPPKIESGFLRQASVAGEPVDYPFGILNSRQDYDRIRLKSLSTIASVVWLDPAWPLGLVYPWPIPDSSYSLSLSVLVSLPQVFSTMSEVLSLPPEYFWALVSNLAMLMRSRWGIMTFPGDTLPGQAKSSLEVLRKANVAISRLDMPGDLNFSRSSAYNIFSDSFN